ncbi:MAG: dihydroorotase [Chlamydiia bacterium]|nr:dihydroorotase [Chlamydiia bacterium]
MPTLTLKNVLNLDGTPEDITLESSKDQTIDGEGRLTVMPALIDPHVHFRVPGQSYKEDFASGARAALAGGVTHVFDMPNNDPPTIDQETLKQKKKLIDKQLADAKIPLRYDLFIGADEKTMNDIFRIRDEVIGIKLFMGCSTNDMCVEDPAAMKRLFQIAAEEQMIVAVHAEDQQILKVNRDLYKARTDVKAHSIIRSRDAAIRATERALDYALDANAEVYFCHVSTKEEVDLIRKAKRSGQLAWLEVTPQHLFFNQDNYEELGSRIQMNPPVREREDQWALWEAVIDGTADTIGTDHAPHTLQEKSRPYPDSPSGMPGVETRLPLLLNAASEGKLSLNRIVELCRLNIESIFQIPTNDDKVLVDLSLEKEVKDDEMKTKCKWSPFSGRKLKGWPVYTILKGEVFRV